MDWSSLHEKKGLGPLSLPLALLSVFYGAGVRLRVRCRGESDRLPGFVLSVGNITTGGTGKTPAVVAIAEWARDQGRRVAVLSRGYGGSYPGEVLEVSDGEHVHAGPHEAGDEPCLLASRLPGVPVVLARKRVKAGLHAHRKFHSDFFLLDDGFQHIGLSRDLDLVLLDAKNPFGNGRLLPWGPLREPLSHLKRASAFLITRCAGGRDEEDLSRWIERRFPGRPVFRSVHEPQAVRFFENGECRPVTFLRGKRVVAFAGVAKPLHFEKTLTEAGALPAAFRAFGDHHRFSDEEIRDLLALKSSTGADLLVTTEKDRERLRGISCPGLAYLTISMKLHEEGKFFAFVQEVLRAEVGRDGGPGIPSAHAAEQSPGNSET